jgi:hypothetical protein
MEEYHGLRVLTLPMQPVCAIRRQAITTKDDRRACRQESVLTILHRSRMIGDDDR